MKTPSLSAVEFVSLFPHVADELTVEVETRWRWREDIEERVRQMLIAEAFASLPYVERLKHVRRPEECDETELLAPIWAEVNLHLGTSARNLPELVEQLGWRGLAIGPGSRTRFAAAGLSPSRRRELAAMSMPPTSIPSPAC